jgi:hypothetical protein
MNDTLQVAVVTLVAAGALAVLVKPYLPAKRVEAPKKASSCANCAASSSAPPAAGAAGRLSRG